MEAACQSSAFFFDFPGIYAREQCMERKGKGIKKIQGKLLTSLCIFINKQFV